MKHFNIPRNLSHNDQQPARFNRLIPIYKEALRAGMWLFHKELRKWYSPEEFYAEYENKELNNYMVTELLENMIIRDPIGGINAANKQLDEMEVQMQTEFRTVRNNLSAFSKKAISYYQQKTIGKK